MPTTRRKARRVRSDSDQLRPITDPAVSRTLAIIAVLAMILGSGIALLVHGMS